MRGVLAPDHTMLEQQEREASKGCSLGGHALVAQWQNIAVQRVWLATQAVATGVDRASGSCLADVIRKEKCVHAELSRGDSVLRQTATTTASLKMRLLII